MKSLFKLENKYKFVKTIKNIMETIDIDFRGVRLEVKGYYSREEPMVMYYPDGSGYPGSSASFEIYEVLVEGIDVSPIMELKTLEELESEILDGKR